MLRERIDHGILEDFVLGLARASALRVIVFDREGRRITGSPPVSAAACAVPAGLEQLPTDLRFEALPAEAPPAQVAFVEVAAMVFIVAPVLVGESLAGYVAVGEFRPARHEAPPAPQGIDRHVADRWPRIWQALPVLERSPHFPPLATARWAARLLARWCQQHETLDAAVRELAALSDISQLIAHERDFQTLLDRIVEHTAHAMKVPYASLRLYDPATDELRIAAKYNLSDDYVNKGRVLRSENPIDDEALRGHVVYIADVRRDPRVRFPEQARRQGIVSGLTAGMIHQGQPIGVLRVYTRHRRRFRSEDHHLLRAIASQAAVAISNARLLEQRLRSLELERQLELAAQVQARMVRTDLPRHPAVELELIYEPGCHLAGDFCDVLPIPDGGLLVAIGDVSGHGVPAALLMASMRGALRAATEIENQPAALLERLNRHACTETSASEFITMLLMRLDADGHGLTYASAGHEPALLIRDGASRRLDHGQLVLGIDPQQRYQQQHLRLRPGDLLIACTDGVVEAMNFDGQLFGRDRLERTAREYAALPLPTALRAIHWDVRRFAGLAERTDDLTMIGLRVRPIGTAARNRHPAREQETVPAG